MANDTTIKATVDHSTKTKKEKRHQRQIDGIIDIVLPIIEERGFNKFTFNEIIQECTLSRTTFFNLIPTKEVIYTHISLRGLDIWIDYCKRAEEYPVKNTRSKLVASFVSYYVFAKTHPIMHKAIFMHNYLPVDINDNLHLSTIYDEKLSFLTDKVVSIVNESKEKNEIQLQSLMTPELFGMSLWHCAFGFITREMHNADSINLEKTLSYYRTYLRGVSDLMNWKPISSEFDYNSEMITIMKAVFPKEMAEFMTPKLKKALME